MSKMEKKVIIKSLQGISIGLIMLALILWGRIPLTIGLVLLSSVGLFEILNVLDKMGLKTDLTAALVLNVIIFLLTYFDKRQYLFSLFPAFTLYTLLRITFGKRKKVLDLIGTLFGILYVSVLLSYLVALDDKMLVLFVFVVAWSTDSFAYLTGVSIGKTKLAPTLSPNKTLEGSIGGIIGAQVITIGYYYLFQVSGELWIYMLMAFIGAILSQLGDLCASGLKRASGVKDFGTILGTHGGVLDRFDSVIFIAPTFYYVLKFLMWIK